MLPASQVAGDWEIVALLGNLAKLLWIIGWEHEELRVQLADVASQRNAKDAHGASLDLLGFDLGVQRFPPRPHTWDADTLFLFHLDDRPVPPQLEVTVVLDDRSRYGTTSHPGQNNGGHSGGDGRFAAAFEFRENQTSIRVTDDPEFALPAGASLTIEAIVKPDHSSTATGAIVAKRSQLNAAAAAGWALSIGSFRGFDRNLRFSLSDGATETELFADRDLGDGVFHLVAGVVDHRLGPPAATIGLLYVDGVEVARKVLDPLAALTNGEPILIGFGRESVANVPTDAQYVGLVDEVRLSKIARHDFHPATGEGDDDYRRRLRVFQRWLLPTPDALARAINELAGVVANDPLPFVVDETVDPMVIGTLPMLVLPAPLPPGGCIASDGNERTTETAAVGAAADEPDFDVAWLRRHEDVLGIDFGGVESHRLMQWSVRAALDALLGRLSGLPGALHVASAFDPTSDDLRSVARALLISHDSLAPDDLAVEAFAAGFGWACHTANGQVYVAQPRAEVFRILPLDTGQLPRPPDVIEGQDLVLDLDPSPVGFTDAHVRWSLTRCGVGEATLLPGSPQKLHAIAAGDISVHAEVSRRRHTRGGSRIVRIGLTNTSLAAGDSIGSDGRRGVTESQAAGDVTDDFSELYLAMRTDDLTGQHTNVIYGAGISNRLMQRGAGAALDRLLDLLAANAGSLQVVKAWDPAGAGLLAQGRALWLRHSNLTARALAARAFAVGFDFVRVDPGPPQTVQVAVRAAEQISVVGPRQVREGNSAAISVEPQAAPAGVCFAANGARAYVTDGGNHRVTSVTVVATPPNAVPRIAFERSASVGPSPGAIAFGGGRVYVAHELSATLSVLDAVTLATGTSIPTGPRPVTMAADANDLFVGCAGDSTLRGYSVTTNQSTATLALPAAPIAIAPIPGGSSLYVVIGGNRFCQVNRANLQLLGAPIPTGAGAGSAIVTPDGTKLYVACAADDPPNATGTVRVYTTSNNQQVKIVGGFPADSPPAVVAVSADQRFVYVATSASANAAGRIHVIDTVTDTLLPQLFTPGSTSRALATSPVGVAFQPCVLALSAQAATLTLGDPAPLGLPQPRPPAVVNTVGLGSGAGERLAWSTVPFSRGRVELSSLVKPAIRVDGIAPGPALVRVIYLRGNHLAPYQFEVRLKPALDAQPGVTIRKDQYDLIMNVLNWFHPLGVEVRTDRLRAHVVELRELNADLFPGYTYPIYHRTGLPLPNAARIEEG